MKTSEQIIETLQEQHEAKDFHNMYAAMSGTMAARMEYAGTKIEAVLKKLPKDSIEYLDLKMAFDILNK
jgi:hypothetical protein